MKQPTIFIVDDEPTNLGVLFEHARRVSWRVLIHTSGASALRAIPNVMPDIILLDIMMPEMDGFEVCRRLKDNPATGDIPVIFVTALSDQVNEVRGLELGAVDYLTKPIQAETAIARIRTHLALRQAQQELAAQNLRLQEEITERHLAEEALAKERNLLKTVLDHAPDFIYVKDRNGGFLLNNPAHLRLLGAVTQVQTLGKTDADFFSPEVAAQFDEDDRNVLEMGESLVNREEFVMTVQRESLWVLATKVPLRNANSDIIGLVGISRNITTLKEAQEALADSERRYRQLVETSPDGIVLHQQGGIVYINPAGRSILGIADTEDVTSVPLLEFIHPDFHALVKERIRRNDEEQQPSNFAEMRFLRRDGQEITVELAGAPVSYQGQIAMQTVFRDMTERKAMENALAEERNLLRTLINSLPDHIYIKDAQSRFLLANNSSVRNLGLTSVNDLIGKTDFDLFSREAAAQYYASEQALLKSGEPIFNQEDINLYHDRDGIAWFQVTKVPFRDIQGNIVGLVGINHDISDMKRAEEQLRAAHRELQEKNAELHELNASKDKFFSIIAHDLRSPFNTLLGFATLLLERIETADRDVLKKQVEMLLGSAERLFALLENLLTWSRIQRGLIQHEPQPLDLNYLASSTIELFHATAEQKHINLQNNILGHPWVNADYYMTTTIMRNLLSNALKFTPSGGQILLTVQENECDVAVSISDSGVGMTQEVLDRLFRIDAHYTTMGTAGEHGSGLGLILCHDLVKKNGGTMTVESELDKGTTFRFTLPRYILPTTVGMDSDLL